MVSSTRVRWLAGAAVLICLVLVWQWVSGPRLYTFNYVDAPVAKVLAGVGGKTGTTLVTNADPESRITLQVRKAPLPEVLDLLAVRMDASMSFAYIFARTPPETASGIAAAAAQERPKDWKIFRSGGGNFLAPSSESLPDLRRISLRPEFGEDRSLHAFLDQAAQKTGLIFLAPADWNPVIGKLPAGGAAAGIAGSTASAVKGRVKEIVVFRVRGGRENRGDGEGMPPFGGGWPGGRRETANPQWVSQREEAMVALLPAEEQEQARKDLEALRQFQMEIQNLPEDQRRAKAGEFFANPEVQNRIEDRMAARDEKRSPDQRARRYQRYFERKQNAQSSGQ